MRERKIEKEIDRDWKDLEKRKRLNDRDIEKQRDWKTERNREREKKGKKKPRGAQ